jgi:hypothetical protein
VLSAHQELQKIQREQAAIAELPTAQLAALTANVNRDPSKGQPFSTEQFCFYREASAPDDGIPPEAAAVALALRHENRCPPLVVAIWSQVLEAAKTSATVPEVRALHSDDDAVWVLAPRWESGNVKAGLVAVRGQISGTVELRELDRPLMRHRLKLPQRAGYGWLEANLLLVTET